MPAEKIANEAIRYTVKTTRLVFTIPKSLGSQNSQTSLNGLYFKIPYNPKVPLLLSSRHN